jgi:hypothetical protein
MDNADRPLRDFPLVEPEEEGRRGEGEDDGELDGKLGILATQLVKKNAKNPPASRRSKGGAVSSARLETTEILFALLTCYCGEL